jgi:KDO2-lipid IV(A) lauroyltransferase
MPNLTGPGLRALTTCLYPLVRLVPAKLAIRLMASVAAHTSSAFAKTRVMDRNLLCAFPERSEEERVAIRNQIVASFGRLVAEIVHLPTFAAGAQGTSVKAVGELDHLFVERKQAICVTAHVANWEVMPIVFHRAGLPLTIIYSLLGNAFIDRVLSAARRSTGATYIEKSEALRSCFKAMKRGESVALLVDQRVEVGAEVDFFGRPTTFTLLPARLALKFGCPIILGETRRTSPGQLEMIVHEPIWPETDAGPRSEHELTQLMASAIEGAIRRQPEAWICNKVRWKKDRKKPGTPVPAKSAADKVLGQHA